jgi:ADP-heptose:LPS heptosyltransferase
LRCQLENMPIISIENCPLGKLAALLSHASLYLGNDSGITHLAGACGVPTIALFGPTDPLIWGPRGAKVKVIRWHRGKSSADTAPLSGQGSAPPVETAKIWALANEWLELEE